MTRRVLVVAAHPDDEVLGCGGTMAVHAAAGDEVHVAFVADGVSSRLNSDAATDGQRRIEEARNAARVLGAQEPRFLGFADQRLDSVGLLMITQKIEEVIASVQPQVVYTHHGADLNLDHCLVHRAVVTALRPVSSSGPTSLYAFETLSSTEWSSSAIGPTFTPTRFVDIDAHLDVKVRAMEAYRSELRQFPHPRSIEAIRALACVRGATSGLRAAEAFETIREVVRSGGA